MSLQDQIEDMRVSNASDPQIRNELEDLVRENRI
jgi:hypothetical protein